jgi:hypothetical protein
MDMGVICGVGLAAVFLVPCTVPDTAPPAAYDVQSVTKNKAVRSAPRAYSPAGNPGWDVYVKGAYVGSDPDPRIRWTLEKEARGGYGTKN